MLRGLLNGLVDIVYPKTCVVCKNKLKGPSCVDNLICLGCWGKVQKNLPPFCHSCGRHLKPNNFIKSICPSCVRSKLYFDRAFCPCTYEGVIKELIRAFKYGCRDYLGRTLSRLMVEFIKEYNVPMDFLDFIVPVPLHKTRMREREFNQAQILGRHISCEFNKELLHNYLLRHRYTKTQTDLDDNERISNVKNSFSVAEGRDIKGKNILLVDDVLTTGATSSEAARVLKGAGANIVFVLTLAG